MTYYLGILNSKGGVGKTSTAMHLAMALSETRSVEVWDSDIQGSATDWAYTAEENNDKLPFAVVSVNYREVQRKQSQAEIVIIDTQPGNSQVLDAVANRSDLLIVPTKPANLDMTRVWATLEAVGNDQPAIVLMTHVNPRTVSYQQAIEALNEAEIAVFDHPIKSLEVIKNNANTTPKNLGGYELVAQELTELIEGMKQMVEKKNLMRKPASTNTAHNEGANFNKVFKGGEGAPKKQLTLKIDEGLHKKIKAYAVENDTTITDLISEYIVKL